MKNITLSSSRNYIFNLEQKFFRKSTSSKTQKDCTNIIGEKFEICKYSYDEVDDIDYYICFGNVNKTL